MHIFLPTGEKVLFDAVDLPLLAKHSWSKGSAGRAFAKVKGKLVPMHRMLLGLMTGDGLMVDHANRDFLDNRRANLRVCTHHQNMQNKLEGWGNKSGLKGVCWHKKSSKWSAEIKYNGSRKYLGLFLSKEDAHEFYCLAADLVHGKFANYGESREMAAA